MATQYKRVTASEAILLMKQLEAKLTDISLTPAQIIQIQDQLIKILKGYIQGLHPGTISPIG